MSYCLDATRVWSNKALKILEADQMRSADTHLIPVSLPGFPSIALYLKDESVHPSGSLKHRLARSLFLYAIVNGWVHEGTTVIENSSGSTAVSKSPSLSASTAYISTVTTTVSLSPTISPSQPHRVSVGF